MSRRKIQGKALAIVWMFLFASLQVLALCAMDETVVNENSNEKLEPPPPPPPPKHPLYKHYPLLTKRGNNANAEPTNKVTFLAELVKSPKFRALQESSNKTGSEDSASYGTQRSAIGNKPPVKPKPKHLWKLVQDRVNTKTNENIASILEPPPPPPPPKQPLYKHYPLLTKRGNNANAEPTNKVPFLAELVKSPKFRALQESSNKTGSEDSASYGTQRSAIGNKPPVKPKPKHLWKLVQDRVNTKTNENSKKPAIPKKTSKILKIQESRKNMQAVEDELAQ